MWRCFCPGPSVNNVISFQYSRSCLRKYYRMNRAVSYVNSYDKINKKYVSSSHACVEHLHSFLHGSSKRYRERYGFSFRLLHIAPLD